MKDRIEAFLTALDGVLRPHAEGEILEIYHIGRSSLVWQYDYAATTQDFDVLRPDGGDRLLDVALKSFGNGAPKAQQHGLYLEVVDPGLPPVPAGYKQRATLANGNWKALRVYHLEPNDFAATKMRRFSAGDREDIRLLCDLGHLDTARLQESMENAFLWTTEKDGDRYRDAAFEHLGLVQRYLRGEIAEF